ncbi:MAG: DUF1080 domain-containing protein [Saprospiraceae bacterium]|nr:DUF1080 domain-containing protein [Saprospiraceae bacterium]
MKIQLFTFLITAFVLASCQNSAPTETVTEAPPVAPENALSTEESAAGWRLLFDGMTLNGWRGYNRPDLPKNGWSVQNGELVIAATPDPRPEDFGGDLITMEKFGNFELSLDFKLSEMANSGVLYFVVEEKDSAIWHNAPEYQLIDNDGWAKSDPSFNMDTHRTGDNYDMEASSGLYMKPVGEWNTARIVQNNGKVEHWLNGQKCLEYEVGSPKWKEQLAKSKFKGYPQYAMNKQGYIGLQDHGHELRFRNIKVRNL